MRGRLTLVLGAITVAAVAGCARVPIANPSYIPQIGVNVVGVGDGPEWPPGRLLIEIGDRAWLMTADSGGGTAWPKSDTAQRVRILRPDDCRVFAQFDAQPDTRWVVTFSSPTDATVAEAVGDVAFAWGPGLGEVPPSGCPWHR